MIARLFLPRSPPVAPLPPAPPLQPAPDAAAEPRSGSASSTVSAETATPPLVRMAVPVRLVFKLKPPLSAR